MKKKNKLSVFRYTKYIGWWKIVYLYRYIPEFFVNLKYAWQRATRGYCDSDLWGLNEYSLNLLSSALKDFKNNLRSRPDTISMEEWQQILTEMSLLFERANRENEFYTNPYEDEWLNSIHVENGQLKSEDGISRDYFEKEKENEEKMRVDREQAFYLFNQYFNDLWD